MKWILQKVPTHRILIIWMGLTITPFLGLLLWDEVESLIQNFQSKEKPAKQVGNLTATQEPFYVKNVNRPMYILMKKQKDGEFWRHVYPYSVVGGGVHSVQELRSAIWEDPVVAKHYLNFNLDTARVIEAKAEGKFHVSYRIGDEIFWTKRRLKVAKGERLITDGTNFTRTRCANVLSEVSPGKTFPHEPPPEVLDTPLNPPSEPTPIVPPVVIGEGPPTTTLPPSEPTPIMPPVVIGGGPPTTTLPPWDPSPFVPPVIIGGGPPIATLPPSGSAPFTPLIVIGGGPANPSAPVPEPSTMLLLGSGLLGLLGLRRKFKK